MKLRVSAEAGGIVRVARRPPGWIAPGPPPRATADRSGPCEGEDLCHLSGDWRILQRLDGHRWSLDDLLTAALAARAVSRPPALAADLGCGIGAVLLMLAWRFPETRVIGVEAQELSADLARRSIAWNGVADRCTVRLGDLRDPAMFAEGRVFDLVTGTPPYFPPGAARESPRRQRGPCRVEHRGGIEDYCAAAAPLLSPGGRFVVCSGGGADRGRLVAGATVSRLRILHRLAVIPRQGKAPLFSVAVLARAEEIDAPVSEARLVVRDDRGEWTAAFRELRAEMGLPAGGPFRHAEEKNHR